MDSGVWSQLSPDVKAILIAARKNNATRNMYAVETTMANLDIQDTSVMTQDEQFAVPTIRSIMASSKKDSSSQAH